MPNQNILIKAITINEAKDNSAIENIVVTTHDEIYKAMSVNDTQNSVYKEVLDYITAIWKGYNLIQEKSFLNTNSII